MQTFTGIADAARAVQDFLFDRDAALPDDVREQLRNMVGPTTSPVDTVVNGAELLYARRDELAAPALELAAGLALIAEQYNFHGMAIDNRGSKLALGLMRQAKVKKPAILGDYPAAGDDPEPRDTYTKREVVVADPIVTPVEDTPPAEGARRGRGSRTGATNTK